MFPEVAVEPIRKKFRATSANLGYDVDQTKKVERVEELSLFAALILSCPVLRHHFLLRIE
jgi:hypothetical protein